METLYIKNGVKRFCTGTAIDVKCPDVKGVGKGCRFIIYRSGVQLLAYVTTLLMV